MKCPYCGWVEQKVLDSRPARDGEAIRRRRECESCGRRFTTFEAPEIPRIYVVKRSGAREEFSAEKALKSMVLASRKRSIQIEKLQAAVERIERELISRFEEEVSSLTIGQMVLEELRDIDTVAFVRFASVYQEFQTVGDFQAILASVRKTPRGTEKIPVG